ncbi:MAG: hypothetical protein FWC08_12105 [Defluviitaleaceae bacterium]|nr:hypothetical protein [Defluviitaleaceae bacterium]
MQNCKKNIAAINEDLHVSHLSYTATTGAQQGTDFTVEKTETKMLKRSNRGLTSYDLLGKITEDTNTNTQNGNGYPYGH